MKMNELQNSLMPGAQRKLKLKDNVLGEMDLIINPADINMVRDILKTQDNHDVQMAKSDLLQCVQNGMKVLHIMKSMNDSDNLEAWVQEKIIKASDYLNTIREYLEGRMAQSHFQFGESIKEGEDLAWDDPDLVKFRELLAKKEKEKSKIKSIKRNGHTEFKGIDKEIERQRKSSITETSLEEKLKLAKDRLVSEVYDGDPGEYFVLRHQTKFDIEREMLPKAWTRVKQFDSYQAAKKEYEEMKAKYPNDKFTVTTHMKKQEQMSEENELDVKTLSLSDIAKKHNVSSGELLSQLRKGIKVELEHTSDLDVAKEIALDHLSEFPDYYDKLERVETSEEMMTEAEKDACYRKVKSRYKVWPSAYASGALVKCRKVGAKNWGNKKKASESVTEMDYGGGRSPHAGMGLPRDDDDDAGKKEIIVKPETAKKTLKSVGDMLNREFSKAHNKGMAVVKPKDEIGFRVADIGPGGKEYNVKTDAAWDKRSKSTKGVAEGKTHISPGGVKTNMDPKDDDYEINYGKKGLVAKFRKEQGVDVKTGSKKVKEQGVAEGLEDTNVQDAIFDTVKRLFHKNEIGDYGALEAIRQGIKHHFSKPGATVESAIDGILNILDKRRNKGDYYLELTRFKEALRQGVAHQLKKQGVAEGSETAADIDKKIKFHQQGQAAAQYKGSMNKMHAAKIRELEAKKQALKQGVAEGSITKSIKRGLQGWGSPQDKPADIVKRNKAYDVDTAKKVRAGLDNAPEHTPAGLQKRVLDRKLKGVSEAYDDSMTDAEWEREYQREKSEKEQARKEIQKNHKSQFKTKDEAIQYANDKLKTFKDSKIGMSVYSMPDGGFDVISTARTAAAQKRSKLISDAGGKHLGTLGPRYTKHKMKENNNISGSHSTR